MFKNQGYHKFHHYKKHTPLKKAHVFYHYSIQNPYKLWNRQKCSIKKEKLSTTFKILLKNSYV